MRHFLFAGFVFAILTFPAVALEPKDVFLVVNRDSPESRSVAAHYVAKRGVPRRLPNIGSDFAAGKAQ